jgi:type IV pilus assembly protein PilY1
MPLSYKFRRNVARITLLAQFVWLLPQPALATQLSIPDIPLFVSRPVAPIVMLDASRDHQLFYKAYNDYTDLDPDKNDGVETTYKHSFDYYGYFDPYKCYTYSTSNSRFEPSASTTNKYCTSSWSGNFLNWVSMSRADVMRKVLFGGARSTDTSSSTVLERATLPSDAHSWAKFYDGSDLNQLTPFSNSTAASASFTTSKSLSGTSFSVPLTSFGYIGDQVVVTVSSTSKFYGVITATDSSSVTLDFRDSVSLPKGSYTALNVSRSGISFCNTTSADSGRSESTTSPPVIRVARGNYSLWSANEKRQCQWFEKYSNTQSGFSGGIRSNGNRYGAGSTLLSELPASAENPSKASVGLTQTGMTDPDYVARVQVCVNALLGTENCKLYDSAYKPIGLLQKYGEGANPRIFFGLTTGSFAKNISGGVVRKNATLTLSGNTNTSDDEIDSSTGVFKSYSGIIKTLSNLRIYGWDYGSSDYISGDSCNYQQIGIVTSGGSSSQGQPAQEGNCSSWGNPMSEVYVESLRYLAGVAKTSAFNYTQSGSKDAAVGLAPPATWSDPLSTSNYCAPLNVLVFNASVSSYDDDQASTAFSTDTNWGTLSDWTNKVGVGEGITGGTKFFVGSNGTTSDGVCTAKAVSNLSDVTGICPEAPSLKGTYSMAGAAYFSHTKAIRTALGPAGDTTPYTVNTYGVSLATSVPRINATVGGNNVVIQPAYRLDLGSGKYGTGTIVDFKIIKQDATSGKFYVNWEDSNQGGDYDQDVLGLISYTVSGSNITVTTQVISASTSNPQGMGFVISGTSKDGPHFYSGIYNFSYTDPTPITVTGSDSSTKINTSGGCNSCADQTDRTPRSAVFSATGTGSASALQDPLYYAAKWGGFVDLHNTGKPDTTDTWDSKKVDGTVGSDGQPDNYYFVTNPGALEQALDTAFTAIVSASAASAVGSNSSSLQTGTTIYQARFNPLNWTGDLVAYEVSPLTGGLSQKWSAQTNLPNDTDSDGRVVLTARDDTRATTAFRWSSLSTAQQTAIQGVDSTTTAQNRVNYLRGDKSNEGASPTQFRARPVTKLGDIVDSSPIYVGVPQGQYSSPTRFLSVYLNSDYTTWRSTLTGRSPIVYVGGNDGMLHGFDAATGSEKLAYIPSQVYPNLINLSSQAYTSNHRYFVNGSPEVADAKFSTGWKSVLVSGMRKGGKGVFALDVTQPSNFSESTASSVGLWEFTSSDDADMGYVYGTPVIAKMANGKWAAIVGNGYNSTNEKAALFILYLEKTGTTWAVTDYKKIVAESAGSNGLAGVAGFDSNLDGTPESLYAGDLKGNLWKFNVSDPDPANWAVALSGSPLAVACTDTTDPCPASKRQPITGTPSVTRHPTNVGSAIVYFGTGKYIENNDAVVTNTSQVQSMYGVWDNNAATKRTNYLVQTITASGTNRTITNNEIDWTSNTGWVENLPASGERVVSAAEVTSGIVFYNTFIPSQSSCDFGGTGYLMAVRYDNGGLLPDIFVGKASTTAGIPIGGSLGGVTILRPGAGAKKALAISNITKLDPANPQPKTGELNPALLSGTRISWRELLQR